MSKCFFRATLTVNLKWIPIPPHWYKTKNNFSALKIDRPCPTVCLSSQFHCFLILQSMQLYLDQRVSCSTAFPCAVLYSQICSRGVWCLGLFSYSHRFGNEDACGSFVMPQPTLFCLGLRCVPFMSGHWLPTHWRIVKTLRIPFEHLLWSYKLMISLYQTLTITY